MDFLVMFLMFALGVCVNACITKLIHIFTKASGTLRIDHSNPARDFYCFEIDDLDKLSKRSRMVLKIHHEYGTSQK